MYLSSYNSIFEVLAGLLIVFTGLEVATQSLTKRINQIIYQISNALDKIVARTALLDKTEYRYSIEGFVSLQKSAKELNSYYLSLSSLGSKKVRTINGDINLGELLLKKKFIPVFLYATFFTFYNLLLCGISATDEVLYFDNITLNGEDVGFKTLLFFSLWSFFFINIFVFRNYRIPYKPYKIKNPIKYYWRNLSRWASPLKVLITSSIGFVLALFFTVITDFNVETIYFKLFIIFLSIFVSIYPFLSLFIWLNIGFNVKRRYIERWSNELVACLNSEENGKINIDNRKKLNRVHHQSKFAGLMLTILRQYTISLITLLSSFIAIYLLLSIILVPDKSDIEKLIIGQTNAEFNSYKKLPVVDTLWFNKYFTNGGGAKKKISALLLHHKINNHTLKGYSNLSSHSLQEIKIIGWYKGRLKVQTSEYWYLKWFESDAKTLARVYVSPSFYPQYFYLIKDKNNIWKIDDIEYFGVDL